MREELHSNGEADLWLESKRNRGKPTLRRPDYNRKVRELRYFNSRFEILTNQKKRSGSTSQIIILYVKRRASMKDSVCSEHKLALFCN